MACALWFLMMMLALLLCDIHDTLLDVNVDDCSCDLICTSSIDLENEALAFEASAR